ncbi:protein of unknown function [Pelosinus fermentans]|nr:DUF362 domain-containing protein [Pelosinus fermentans]OAM96294.1 protein of unknown function DUF362 [Pelosinus fermentans DSM 17108]SDR38530.1 protein of unknown function [Pelosinus fermentans]
MEISSFVEVIRCPVSSTEDEIFYRLQDCLNEHEPFLRQIRNANNILIKVNLMSFLYTARDERNKLYKGRPIASTDPMVVAGLIRLLRFYNPSVDINIIEGVDLDLQSGEKEDDIWKNSGYDLISRKYDVGLLNTNTLPVVEVSSGDMHSRYWIPKIVLETDMLISAAKLKIHGTAGITLSIKNMFGLLPSPYYGDGDRGGFILIQFVYYVQ